MKFTEFLKDKIIQIGLLIFALATIEIFLIMYQFAVFLKFYIPIIIIAMYIIGIVIEYIQKNKYYSEITGILESLTEKYLITEIINKPTFIEGQILEDILAEVNKAMIENVNKYKYLQKDYKEYIELWIHEIKLPLATSKMIIENNKSEITERIDEELDKVENYIEQALFYARSNTVEKDYYIRKTKLQEIVNESIKKNKNVLIGEKALINLHDLEIEVNTDSKWVVYILNQIIQNSVKYRKKDMNFELEIYSEKQKENIVLYIKDNGIGIKQSEIDRVFDKGFTGTNGRHANKKSTGIGLYLCKNLCEKLGISINIKSEEGVYTEIVLTFPQNSFYQI